MTEENLSQAQPEQPETPKNPVDKPKKDPREKLYHPERPLILASSPHFHAQATVPKIMWNVIAALVPTTVLALVYFQWAAVGIILISVGSALIAETLVNRVKGEAFTIPDGSALITGLLLALTLPPSFSLGGTALGSVFAIVVGKHFFGGLGYNIFNPALLGRAFLQASFPVPMTTWTWPLTARYADVDGITAATPLGLFKFEHVTSDLSGLLTGNISGSLGETSAIAILIGGLYLLIRKYADWRIPLSLLGATFLVSGVFWLISPTSYPSPVFQLFSGGLMLGAFFMATDMVTSPVTARGAWIFGTGAGCILVIIRLFGGLPEGVMYSILLMNAFTPLINRYTRPKFFGEVRA
ncbi:MAG: RnfABCDGE type electron transport complex subunit D [Candidatus Marinimicrobia bacterium]|nr:RnfABCDGE type electron transport complex subunit D [Candidatus Neomarinimicrobiota bacterium]